MTITSKASRTLEAQKSFSILLRFLLCSLLLTTLFHTSYIFASQKNDKICFSKIVIDAENIIGTVAKSEISNTTLPTEYKIMLSTYRCRCLENSITSSIESFLKDASTFNLSETNSVICLTDVRIWEDEIHSASGFHLK